MIQFFLLIFIIGFLIMSCGKDDKITEIQACDIQIDPSIKIDTAWKQNYGEFTAVKFFEKYFIVSKLDSNMTIYSNNDGKMMAKLEPPLISRGSLYDCQIENDYYYGFLKNKILRYNIITKEYQFFPFSGDENFVKIVDDEYYFPDGNFLLKGNFKNSNFDTILNYNKLIPDSFFEGNFAFYNDKLYGYDLLAFILKTYNPAIDDSENSLIVYSLKTKHVLKKVTIPRSSYSFSVYTNYDMIIFNSSPFKLVYYVDDGNYFVMNNFLWSNSEVLAIPRKKTINENYKPKVFFNNEYLTCYDFYNTNSNWSCKYTHAYNLSSINLIDSKNNEITYIGYLNKNDYKYYLQDPYTGVKVSEIDVTAEYSPKFSYQYYVSDIIDNKYIIMTLGGNFYRFDIIKI